MSKLLLAVAIAVSFVSVQGRVQRARSLGAVAQAARSGQPTSPLHLVSLGTGTTRAIERDRHLAQLDVCMGQCLPVRSYTPRVSECSPAALSVAARGAPPLRLRI